MDHILQNQPVNQVQRRHYPSRTAALPRDLDALLTGKGFSPEEIIRLKSLCGKSILTVLYHHLKQPANMMDTYGFLPKEITRVVGVHGGAHNLTETFDMMQNHQMLRQLSRKNILSMAAHNGGYKNLVAFCSQSRLDLEQQEFSTGQAIRILTGSGGQLRLALVLKYQQRILDAGKTHEQLVKLVYNYKSGAVKLEQILLNVCIPDADSADTNNVASNEFASDVQDVSADAKNEASNEFASDVQDERQSGEAMDDYSVENFSFVSLFQQFDQTTEQTSTANTLLHSYNRNSPVTIDKAISNFNLEADPFENLGSDFGM